MSELRVEILKLASGTIVVAPRILLLVGHNPRLQRAIRLEIGADFAKCRKFVPVLRIGTFSSNGPYAKRHSERRLYIYVYH
ncbi:hypothetical protein GB937_010258 [Aspergillus fischeri]|nr:hypothetical protein GB937_010258 [Aspergillus fischeri]